MYDFTITLSILSIVISLYAVLISIRGLYEQRRIASITNNYLLLAESNSLIVDYPDLLTLHNITNDDLTKVGATANEVVYIWKSIQAAQIDYEISNAKTIDHSNFSEYRKNLLKNEKVRLVWSDIIRPKLIDITQFALAVDEFYKHH